MNTKTQKALRRLAGNNKPALKLAMKLARGLLRGVHAYGTSQALYCTNYGTYYVAYQQ